MLLTEEDDKSLRNYAKWLNPELGEDAYHEAIYSIVKNPPKQEIRNLKAFIIQVIKWTVQKMIRKIQINYQYESAWKFDDRPPGWGPSQHEACRRGHPFTQETIVYKGKHRTCLICKRMCDAKLQKAYREKKKVKLSA